MHILRASLFGEYDGTIFLYDGTSVNQLIPTSMDILRDDVCMLCTKTLYEWPYLCLCELANTILVHAESSFRALGGLSEADWKKEIKVIFSNDQGVEERGIDGGGLFKEFVDVLLKEMFSLPSMGSSAGGDGDVDGEFVFNRVGM